MERIFTVLIVQNAVLHTVPFYISAL